MSTNRSLLKISNIEVSVLRKNIKNVYLNVLPPKGNVRISVPWDMGENAIHTFLATRLPWIKKQRANFKQQARQTQREYISGESHYFLGNRYRLEVKEGDEKPHVHLDGKKKIVLSVRPDSDREKRELVMQEWCREELTDVLKELVEKWQKKIDVEINFWGTRRMKTKWGSCNGKDKRILFNLELAKKPKSCIEYVVVHELVHLKERKHNDKFVDLMDKFLPKWRSERDELNRMILAYEEWR